MPGNFKILTLSNIDKLKPETSTKLCWGTAKNEGDADYVAVCFIDRQSETNYGCGKSEQQIPANTEFSFEVTGKLPDIGKDWDIRFVMGYLTDNTLHITDERNFIIKRDVGIEIPQWAWYVAVAGIGLGVAGYILMKKK